MQQEQKEAKEAEEAAAQKQKQNQESRKLAIVMQSLFRAKQGRKKAVAMVNELGTLLARPGTIQGQSGWYEYQEKCLRYDVSGDEWIQKEGPISVQEWKMQMRAEQTDEGKKQKQRQLEAEEKAMSQRGHKVYDGVWCDVKWGRWVPTATSTYGDEHRREEDGIFGGEHRREGEGNYDEEDDARVDRRGRQ